MDQFHLNLSTNSSLIVVGVSLCYIFMISFFGIYFSRFNKDINDFFYSGRRFSWWLPTISMVATGVGSYSYLKYSEQGLNTGLGSMINHTNDFFVLPLFIFGWLPILYFSKIKSIPEYFSRRFNSTARYISLVIIMSYMLFYIGYNFYTIGVALEGMFGFSQLYTIPILACFLAFYLSFGGQTAVIFTDMFQGILLYFAGFIVAISGIIALGGFSEFWSYLPEAHRFPLPHLNKDPSFNTVGLFWGEALAGSIAFAFMNQGFIMRYLTIRSMSDARKACLFNVMITSFVTATIIGCVGWIGKSILMKQAVLGSALDGYNLIEIKNTFHTFITVCWETLKHNAWLFGFVVSALLAALMSTIDTLINACSAVCIYDLYKPLVKPKASDKHYLKAAQIVTLFVTFLGVLLVIWFNKQKGTLMAVHYKGIMTIIPSIVTTIFMGAFWKNFTAPAACLSMVFGCLITLASVWFPSLIHPIADFVLSERNESYIFMRALFGMTSTALMGVILNFFFIKKHNLKRIEGLTVDSLKQAMFNYKGSKDLNFSKGKKVFNLNFQIKDSLENSLVEVHPSVMKTLKAKVGDLVYLSDQRWYLGGLRSIHLKVHENKELNSNQVRINSESFKKAYFLKSKTLSLEKLF